MITAILLPACFLKDLLIHSPFFKSIFTMRFVIVFIIIRNECNRERRRKKETNKQKLTTERDNFAH